jgi:hypothetical protein
MIDAGVGDEYREQRVSDHRQQRPASPGGPAADLMLVQASQTLAGLEALLDRPATPGDADQFAQRHRVRGVAAVERQLTGPGVAADQQPPVLSVQRVVGIAVSSGVGAVVMGDPRPLVEALALCAGPAESRCQALRGSPAASSSARIGPAAVWMRRSQPIASTYPTRAISRLENDR